MISEGNGKGALMILSAGASVRALTRDPARAALPADVEVIAGDFIVPESLDPALDGITTLFLLWTAEPWAAPAVVAQLAARARRVVYLSAPFRTPHQFFQQPNPMREMHAPPRTFAEWAADHAAAFAGNSGDVITEAS